MLNQHSNTIILNATGTVLNSDGSNRAYMRPIRETAQIDGKILHYDKNSGELKYSNNVSHIENVDMSNLIVSNSLNCMTGVLFASKTGNVGIGTTTPASTLDVRKNGSDYVGAFYNTSATGEGVAIRGGDTSSQNALVVQNYDGNRAILIARSDGNVGIGTSNPIEILHIAKAGGGSQNGGRIRLQNTGTRQYSIGTTGASFNVFDETVQLDRLNINTNGNIGIGTNNQATRLVIGDSAITTDQTQNDETLIIKQASSQPADRKGGINLISNNALANDIGVPIQWVSSYTGSLGYATAQICGRRENTGGDAAGYLQFATSNSAGSITEKMRITSNGFFGFGTNAPSVPFTFNTPNNGTIARFQAGGNDCSIGLLTSIGTCGAIVSRTSAGTGNGQLELQSRLADVVSTKLTISPTGFVGIGTTTPTERLQVEGNILSTTNNSTSISILSNGQQTIRGNGWTTNLNLETRTSSGVINSNQLVLNGNNGNVGIGTTTPIAPLTLATTKSNNNLGAIGINIQPTTTGVTGDIIPLTFTALENTNRARAGIG
ncbi:hypothetical protein EBU95_18185, partial [bacterium]|nr:hypothetical protein [bacterium]